jgi:ribosome-associated toxin RatA of RatAB toxin-antitoxin module
MRSSLAIDVAAPAELVFSLARDVTRWPQLLPHYVTARARKSRGDGSRVVDFVARRDLVPLLGLGVPVTWRARCWSDPTSCELRFVHVAGATAGMDVTWRIEPTDAGCRVTIEHVFEPTGPLASVRARVTDRFFVRPIATRTLATFGAIAEAIEAVGAVVPVTAESNAGPVANQPT